MNWTRPWRPSSSRSCPEAKLRPSSRWTQPSSISWSRFERFFSSLEMESDFRSFFGENVRLFERWSTTEQKKTKTRCPAKFESSARNRILSQNKDLDRPKASKGRSTSRLDRNSVASFLQKEENLYKFWFLNIRLFVVQKIKNQFKINSKWFYF